MKGIYTTRDIKFRGKSGEKRIYGNLLTYKASGILLAKIWEHNEDGSLGGQHSVYVKTISSKKKLALER